MMVPLARQDDADAIVGLCMIRFVENDLGEIAQRPIHLSLLLIIHAEMKVRQTMGVVRFHNLFKMFHGGLVLIQCEELDRQIGAAGNKCWRDGNGLFKVPDSAAGVAPLGQKHREIIVGQIISRRILDRLLEQAFAVSPHRGLLAGPDRQESQDHNRGHAGRPFCYRFVPDNVLNPPDTGDENPDEREVDISVRIGLFAT